MQNLFAIFLVLCYDITINLQDSLQSVTFTNPYVPPKFLEQPLS